MKVAVGSQNPVKIEATRRVFEHFFDDVQIIPVEVDSGISDMPLNDEESITGSINRTKNAISEADADFGVGLEGGVHDFKQGMMLHGFVAVVNKEGKVGVGDSGGLILPDVVANEVRQGKELGKVMDELVEDKDTKKKMGAVGLFTKGYVDRTHGFEIGVAFALGVFLDHEFLK